MANLKDLIARLKLDSTGFGAGLRDAQGKTKGFSVAIRGMMAPVAAALAGAFAGAAIKGQMDYIDQQAKTARSIDGTVNSLRALQIAASDAGVGDMTNDLQNLGRELAKADNAGSPAAKSLQALNLQASDLKKMDADERLATIADRIKDMGLSAGEATALLQGLGVENRKVALLMIQGGDAIRAARTEVDALGIAISQVDAAKIESANDAMSRISLAAEALKNRIAIALAPALKSVADGFTASLRQGGLLRFAIDAVTLGIEVLVAVANMAATAFSVLRSAIDLPESAFRWLFGLGPTALEAQRAIDQLTLAIGSEIQQAAALTGALGPGVTVTKQMAESKLAQARAHLANIDAMRQERIEMVTNSAEWRSYQTTLEQMGRTMARIVEEQNSYTYDRGEIEDFLEKMNQVRAAQQSLLGSAASLSPEYQAVVAEIARIEAALANATGETVTFVDNVISAEDITRRVAESAQGISFASANSSAAELARKLGVSLTLAQQLQGLGFGEAALADGDGRGTQRDAAAGAREFRRDRWMAQNQARLDALKKSALGIANIVSDGVAAASGAGEAKKAKKEVEEVTTAMEGLERASDNVKGAFQGAFVGIVTGAKSVKQALSEMLSKFAEMLANRAFEALWGGIGKGGGGTGFFGKLLGGLFGIGKNANGTNNWRGGLSWVGEQGPELVNLPRGSQVFTNQQSRAMAAGGGGTLDVRVSVDNDGQLRAFVERTAGNVVSRAAPEIVRGAVQATYVRSKEEAFR